MTAPAPRPGQRPTVRFLTPTEIATAMRVSKMTVYRLIHAGVLPGSVRVGRSFRVPELSVRQYLEDGRVGSS